MLNEVELLVSRRRNDVMPLDLAVPVQVCDQLGVHERVVREQDHRGMVKANGAA